MNILGKKKIRMLNAGYCEKVSVGSLLVAFFQSQTVFPIAVAIVFYCLAFIMNWKDEENLL